MIHHEVVLLTQLHLDSTPTVRGMLTDHLSNRVDDDRVALFIGERVLTGEPGALRYAQGGQAGA